MSFHKKFNPHPFAYHQEVELTIETLTNLGLGLGRVDISNPSDTASITSLNEANKGWVVMVSFTLPGEKVKARVFRNHKNYSEADLLEVLDPSPHRIIPPCPIFGTCGGCQYQHLVYKEQLVWKQIQVKETFKKIAGIDFPVNPTFPSPKEYHYRSKITPHYHPHKEGQAFPIGFLRQGQHSRLVDVPNCPIATEAINEVLPELRQKAFHSNPKKNRGATLLLRHTEEGVVTDPNQIVSEKVGNFRFKFKAGDFFQNNPFILPHLVDYVVQQAQRSTHYLIDTYCGVGLFAISGSSYFERCIGVEVNPEAIAWAKANASINQISNVNFHIGHAEAIFGQIPFNADETAVVLDPPRAGCDQSFLEQLLSFSPKRIVYISCDPATQARDVARIINSESKYKLISLQPFDLFPQTRHIENVACLEKF